VISWLVSQSLQLQVQLVYRYVAASFYGSAAAAADAMLREAYVSTNGPPGMQDPAVGLCTLN
jgi:hypothetical protein